MARVRFSSVSCESVTPPVAEFAEIQAVPARRLTSFATALWDLTADCGLGNGLLIRRGVGPDCGLKTLIPALSEFRKRSSLVSGFWARVAGGQPPRMDDLHRSQVLCFHDLSSAATI